MHDLPHLLAHAHVCAGSRASDDRLWGLLLCGRPAVYRHLQEVAAAQVGEDSVGQQSREGSTRQSQW